MAEELPESPLLLNPSDRKRISWGAIFAGVTVVLVVQLLLSMLGLGIGMSTIDPLQGNSPGAGGFAIGAAVWWTVTMLVSLFAGGWVAGRLAGLPRRADGAIHGFVSWGVATLLSFALLTTAVGRMISGTLGMVGRGLNLAGRNAPELADQAQQFLENRGVDLSSIKDEAQTLLRQTGNPEAQGAAQRPQDDEVNTAIDRALGGAKGAAHVSDRDALINVLVARTDLSRPEAARTVDQWEQKARRLRDQAEQKARQAGDRAAKGVSMASLWSFFGLLLGAIAAAAGGGVGAPRLLEETEAG